MTLRRLLLWVFAGFVVGVIIGGWLLESVVLIETIR